MRVPRFPCLPEATAALRRLGIVALGLGLALLTGRAALPPGAERTASHALPASADTPLGRIAAASLREDAPELSGFRLLPDGPEAFETRLLLARRAYKSLDVQYYLIAHDASGREFVRELELAATMRSSRTAASRT